MKQRQKLFYAAGSLGAVLSYQAFVTHIQFLYIDLFVRFLFLLVCETVDSNAWR